MAQAVVEVTSASAVLDRVLQNLHRIEVANQCAGAWLCLPMAAT